MYGGAFYHNKPMIGHGGCKYPVFLFFLVLKSELKGQRFRTILFCGADSSSCFGSMVAIGPRDLAVSTACWPLFCQFPGPHICLVYLK